MKKGQLKMMETVGALFVFFIILIISFSIYVTYKGASINEEVREHMQKKANQDAQQILYLPEFRCSFSAIDRSNCIDYYKAQGFSNLVDSSNQLTEKYFTYFSFANITLYGVYPHTFELELYAVVPPRGEMLKHRYHFPISIYDAINDTYSYGLLKVDVYE